MSNVGTENRQTVLDALCIQRIGWAAVSMVGDVVEDDRIERLVLDDHDLYMAQLIAQGTS